MSIAKIIEVSASSTKSFEDAARKGIREASKSLDNITGAWIKDQEVGVKDGEVTDYRVKMKVTFILKS